MTKYGGRTDLYCSRLRADYSCERRRAERPAEWTEPIPFREDSTQVRTGVSQATAPHQMSSGRRGETPRLSENKPSRRPPLVPVMESTDVRSLILFAPDFATA
jgi:hypothetical protein